MFGARDMRDMRDMRDTVHPLETRVPCLVTHAHRVGPRTAHSVRQRRGPVGHAASDTQHSAYTFQAQRDMWQGCLCPHPIVECLHPDAITIAVYYHRGVFSTILAHSLATSC